MLLALAISSKFVIAAVFVVVFVVAMIVFLPGAIVREVTQSENTQLPQWMGTVRARRARLRICLAVLGAIGIGAVAFVWSTSEPKKTVLVVVDNTSSESIVLRHKDSDVLVVAPHSTGRWQCAAGTHRIVLVRGQQTVLDRQVELADEGKYIANPDATSYYGTWLLEYSAVRFPNIFAKTSFEDLLSQARRIRLIEPTQWHEVSADYVLETPPASIQSKSPTASESKVILSRLSKESFDVLKEAKTKRFDNPPDEKYVDKLNQVILSLMFERNVDGGELRKD